MKNFINLSAPLIFVLLFQGVFVYSVPEKYDGKIVRRIDFVGVQNTNSGDLIHIMKTTVNFPLKAEDVRRDIKEVFKKGKFESVTVDIEEFKDGVALRFTCKERPIIKELLFKGLKNIYESDLKEVITIKEGDVFRKDYLEKSIKQIKAKYDEEGYFGAMITYKKENIRSDGSLVKLTFVIDEGDEIKVRKLILQGAKKIYPKVLRSIMETAERGFLQVGTFNKEKYEQDKLKILQYYKQEGYIDAQIIEDELTYEWVDPTKKTDRGIYITIKISEGEIYYFDKYTVKINGEAGKTVFKPEDLTQKFEQTNNGDIFNDTKFQMDRQSISFKYATKGYIFARVVPNKTIVEKEVEVKKGVKEKRKFVTIDFVIDEGSQAYVESVIIKGNSKTKSHVIKREVVLYEGEIFDASKMQISRERIFNLGFFKQVNVDVRPGSREGYMNLIIDVEEQPSGTISLGGGYGTTTGFSIFADLAENNLLGNGQRVGLKFEYGPVRSSITLSFDERWLFGVPLSFSASIFYYYYQLQSPSLFPNTYDIAQYYKEAVGYSLGLGYRFLYFFNTGIGWSQAWRAIKNPSGNSPDIVFQIGALGYQDKRTLSTYLYFDNKDNYLNPTRGVKVGVTIYSTGGWLGGQDHYMRYNPEFFWYFSPFHIPFLKTHPLVFEFRMTGTFLGQPLGNVNQDYAKNEWLEYEDRLTIGGVETLRAWNYYDPAFATSWRSAGLYHRILYGLEFRIPILPQMLWIALFFDAGSLWSDSFWENQMKTINPLMYGIIAADEANGSLRRIDQFFQTNFLAYFKYSYGIGIRVQIPMMPLRFWFGQKMVFQNNQFMNVPNGFNFQFAIGDMRF